MKPLDISSFDGLDISKLSKKKQVNILKEQLGQMPFTLPMNDKISELKNSALTASPKFKNLTDSTSQLNSSVGSCMPSSFVTEALHAMKENNQDKVKIFIQGSADNVGHKTFTGTLDKQFFYDRISVLPKKDDPEKFSSTPQDKQIPQTSFKNIHLPDLRAQFLKEMIGVYSKKFDPVVLEGVVKDIKDEGERNAIIYLYLPEEIITE